MKCSQLSFTKTALAVTLVEFHSLKITSYTVYGMWAYMCAMTIQYIIILYVPV